MLHRLLIILLVAAASLRAEQPAAPDLYQQLATYDYGQNTAALVGIEAEIRQTPPAGYKAIEAKLLAVLRAKAATPAAKEFACRQLRLVGSGACLPVVAPLLIDPKLSHMARYAVQGMADSGVDPILRAALAKAGTNPVRIGLINTLGVRGDSRAVLAIAKFINDPDPLLAGAAMQVLGQIGGTDALAFLAKANVPASLKLAHANADLLCADKFAAQHALVAAEKIYRQMYAATNPVCIRIAALRGIVLTTQEAAIPVVLGVVADQQQPAELRAAAAQFLVQPLEPGAKATRELTTRLAAATPAVQAVVLGVLADRGDRTAAPAVLKFADSADAGVQLAALQALGALGDKDCVPVLLKAASKGGDSGKAAETSLTALRPAGVDEALMAQLAKADASASPVLLRALTARRCYAAVPAVMKAAQSSDANVRRDAYAALRVLVVEENFGSLVDLLVSTGGSSEAEDAVAGACARLKSATLVTPVMAALPGAKPELRCALLRALGQIGGPTALAAVRADLNSTNEKVAETAMRTLAGWPDAAAVPDLLALAKTAKSEKFQILAFRGYVRLLTESKPGTSELLRLLEGAMKLAPRPDEKKLVIGALGELKTPAALPVLAGVLAEPALQADAGAAYLRVVESLKKDHKAEAISSLKKFLELSKDEGQRATATKLLHTLQPKQAESNK